MSFKAILFCAQALLIQAISSQCIGAYNGLADGYAWGAAPYAEAAWGAAPYEAYNDWASPCNDWAGPWNSAARMRAAEYETAAIDSRYPFAMNGGLGPASMAASNGGGLAITSSSPISPNGVSLISENAIEGPLAVSGEIPFLGAVALEGALPTAGSGGVAYGCGNGNVAILNEDIGAYSPYGAYAPGIAAAPAYAAAPALAAAAPFGAGYANPAFAYNRGCGCGRF
ncbi:unnamed protein product [Leptosia nina]|uniref:Uncharacterized protein n=1 Tax=Leptosia nina TaxID=320188 RepID=A0AAV1JK21_9NEOP